MLLLTSNHHGLVFSCRQENLYHKSKTQISRIGMWHVYACLIYELVNISKELLYIYIIIYNIYIYNEGKTNWCYARKLTEKHPGLIGLQPNKME